jgi:glycosyltransferase involved in cell wall biosynthesis
VNPLRLLAIIEAYSITGPAKNLLEFVQLARAEGVETTIATFTRDAKENLFVQTAREAGIPVETIREKGPFDPAVIRTLQNIGNRLRPDIIQTHAVKSHFLARRAHLPQLAPWVAFHHGYTWPTLRARAYNQLDRWSLRAAPRVVTVSRPFREELARHGVPVERIEIVHNAIPPDWGARARQTEEAASLRLSLGIPADRKVILIVGRLSREKDHLTLLESIAGMPSSIAAHLLIVGDGPERARIEERIASLGLGAQVTFTGHQSSAEPYYGVADLAALSSHSEGSPNALLLAMAAGIPVVATAVGGIPEIVTHGESALLVTPGDAEGMRESMVRLLVKEPLLARALVERSRMLIRERHAPEARMLKLLGLYRNLLHSR